MLRQSDVAEAPRVQDCFDMRLVLGDAAQNVHRTIGRMVVDDNVLLTVLGEVCKQPTHTVGQNLDVTFFVVAGTTRLMSFIFLPSFLQRTTLPSGVWLLAGQRSRSGPAGVLRDQQMERTVLCRLQE
jgi:hypothetical protein